ncbi:uncharacterized protein LOC121879390 isoform X2 [Homarus americanus]|uniref:uncharacterized protein LOC121879390 isoform X2 n=1 Tax=Homarus americanus TaxID=6706 RepID=UPI001C4662AF|nr:uncharacterized protein LOC121879390 isoform X2 [Homarus americanus]
MRDYIKGQAEDTTAAPQKKVTFYGPVMSTKGEKLRHVGTKMTPRKRTLLSSALKSTSKDKVIQSVQHTQLQSVNDKLSKPHSKTTVTGIPTKTRLNCNHLRPKCQCSTIANKKKVSKVRHKSAVTNNQRRILVSTRSLPRGELNGCKNYKEKDDSLSILDGNWKPGLDVYSKDHVEGLSDNNENIYLDVNKDKVENNEGNSKKKVQFAEETSKHIGSWKSNKHQNHSHLNVPRENINSESLKGSSQPNLSSDDHYSSYHNSSYTLDPHNTPNSPGYDPKSGNALDDDRSMTDQQLRKSREYCRLCELSKDDSPRTFTSNTMNYNLDEHDEEYPSDHEQYSSKYEFEEPCHLCMRYGRWHSYSGKQECCELCEKHNNDAHILLDLNEAKERSLFHKTRRPLHRKLSSPVLSSEIEEPLFTKRIPYEPRTQLVKNLKQKLEEEYRNDEYMQRNNFRRRWRSWDAEEMEEFHRSRLHNYSKAQDHSSCHKCIHCYLQNERLFLEPTITDRKGQSVCRECGAPQHTDPDKNPYLYHITLGGVKDSNNGMGPIEKQEKVWKNKPNSTEPGKKIYNQTSEDLPGDTSKHIFAKLNKNINNILPGGSGYSLRPWAADKLRYCGDPHSKRHPSRSMALLDHII